MNRECDEFGSEKALKIAKAHVEKYYSVVGIIEKWQESLQLLEHYVPSYFQSICVTVLSTPAQCAGVSKYAKRMRKASL